MKKSYRDIIDLWERVFGDEEEFIVSFLDKFYDGNNAKLKYNAEGELIGMAFLPVFDSADGLRVGYLYAVAVDEKYRSRGIASELISALLDKNKCDVMATIPASESLRKWYASRFGFVFPDVDVKIIDNLDFDLGTGNKDDDIYMIRIVNLNGYLSKYALLNKQVNDELYIIDNIISDNTGVYIVKEGKVEKKNINSDENLKEINLISHKFKLFL